MGDTKTKAGDLNEGKGFGEQSRSVLSVYVSEATDKDWAREICCGER